MQCSLKFKKQEPNNSSQLPREKAYLIYIYIYIYIKPKSLLIPQFSTSAQHNILKIQN